MTGDEVEALREGWDFEAKLAASRDGQLRLRFPETPNHPAQAYQATWPVP